MSETRNGLTYLIGQDPWVIAGFLLIGASALLFFRLYQKLKIVRDRSYARFTLPILFVFTIPRAYLRYAGRWSPLPAYVLGCVLPLGSRSWSLACSGFETCDFRRFSTAPVTTLPKSVGLFQKTRLDFSGAEQISTPTFTMIQ
jgi:hypothetical protein